MRETPLIAIVDDDAPLRQALGNLLRSAGYDIVLFPSAEAFLAEASPGRYNLILSDYRMGGASGTELACVLKEKGCVSPVVIMTAQAFEEVEDAAIAAGAAACLQKPFNEDDFLEIIEDALSRRPAGNGSL